MDRRDRVVPCLRHALIGHGIGMVDAIRKQLGIDRSVGEQIRILINGAHLLSTGLESRYEPIPNVCVVVHDGL